MSATQEAQGPARPDRSGRRAVRAELGAAAGRWTARVARTFGRDGGVIGGRVALGLAPGILTHLASGRRVVLVTGTNGKTTTAHLIAAALRADGPAAHNASGANMPRGVTVALLAAPDAAAAVLEVDELHLAAVAAAVHPEVIVLLNLSRDQLDRATEVRGIAAGIERALLACPNAVVVANADDPMTVWAARRAVRTVWVAGGRSWSGEATTCPRCAGALTGRGVDWLCRDCAFGRPAPSWTREPAAASLTLPGVLTAVTPDGERVVAGVRLPGEFNMDNALVALATASVLGLAPARSAAAFGSVYTVSGRYAQVEHAGRRLRMLLAKNPASWAATLPLLNPAHPLLLAVNARVPDGRDTSWLWDVPFEAIASPTVVASGESAADLGVRLGYAGVGHCTVADPLAALVGMPGGPVDVVANYSAFQQLHRSLARSERG